MKSHALISPGQHVPSIVTVPYTCRLTKGFRIHHRNCTGAAAGRITSGCSTMTRPYGRERTCALVLDKPAMGARRTRSSPRTDKHVRRQGFHKPTGWPPGKGSRGDPGIRRLVPRASLPLQAMEPQHRDGCCGMKFPQAPPRILNLTAACPARVFPFTSPVKNGNPRQKKMGRFQNLCRHEGGDSQD